MRSGEEDGKRSRASDIKSNNPHLAGGEKKLLMVKVSEQHTSSEPSSVGNTALGEGICELGAVAKPRQQELQRYSTGT